MMMETTGINAFFSYDDSIRTAYEGARHLTNPTSLGSCQQPYTSAEAVPVPSDRMISMTELMVCYNLDHTCASSPLDHGTEPVGYAHIPPTSCVHTNPNESTYSRGHFEYNSSAKLDSVDQYQNNALVASHASHAGPHHDQYTVPMAPAVSEYPFFDNIPMLLSTSNPLHDTPSSEQERCAETSLMAPIPIKGWVDGTPGYHHSPVFKPSANTDPHSNVVFSVPLLYSNPDRMVQELRRLRLGSQGHVPPHFESVNPQQFIINLPSGYSGPRCSSPDPMLEVGQGDLLSVATLTNGHNEYPSLDHPTPNNWAGSYEGHMPARAHSRHPSGHSRGLTSPPYCIPNKLAVNEIRRPQPRPRVHTTGRIPDYIFNGQVPPASIPSTGESNDVASSSTFSETECNYPTQQPTIWGGRGRSFSVENPARTDKGHSSVQYSNLAFSSSTYPAYQNDMAVSTPSTGSFPGWSANVMGSPQLSPKAQLPNPALPGLTPPFQRDVPRQETLECTPDCFNPDEASPKSPDTDEEGHFAALSPILADGEQKGLSAATHPSNARRAQQRLQIILERPSPPTNEALITLLRLILESSFIWTHEMESTIESDYGQALLAQVKLISDCPANVLQLSRGSIYTAFVLYPEFVCLICGKPKQSMIRGIGCVRSHLDHRPFPCRGQRGCKSCPKGKIIRRFFTASLLHDHRSAKGTPCTFCGATLKSSMKRHWDSKHHDVPFPYDHYPRYRKEQPLHS